MIRLYDVVKLKEDREDIGVLSSYDGTVVDIVDHHGNRFYTVEFFDADGETIDESLYVYFRENELEVVRKYEGKDEL